MRVFLDTNILLEYLCERPKASVVNDLLDLLEEKKQFFIYFLFFILYYSLLCGNDVERNGVS